MRHRQARHTAVIVGKPARSNVPEIIAALLRCGFDEGEIRETILPVTAQDKLRPSKEWKTSDGWVTLRYHGLSRFSLEHTVIPRGKRVVNTPPRGYSRISDPVRDLQKGKTMPPARGRRASAPPVESEPVNGEVDYGTYLDKAPTAKMTDYATWFEDHLLISMIWASPIRRGSRHWARPCTRPWKSEFRSSSRSEKRRAERSAPEPEAEAPARTQRGARGAKPAAATGRGRGRRATADAGAGSAPY